MGKTIYENSQTTQVVDENGTVKEFKTTTETRSFANTEPDYIKIYTRMWCEFNQIPEYLRSTFFELAIRMSYCNTTNLESSQIVYTGGPFRNDIMRGANIKNDDVFCRHLKELVKCNAIKKVGKGCYQINPQYAGRGAWKYNAREQQGGIEDLVATFNFKKGTVDTKIIYAEHSEGELAEHFGLKDDQQIKLTESNYKPFDGQIELPKDGDNLPWAQ